MNKIKLQFSWFLYKLKNGIYLDLLKFKIKEYKRK